MMSLAGHPRAPMNQRIDRHQHRHQHRRFFRVATLLTLVVSGSAVGPVAGCDDAAGIGVDAAGGAPLEDAGVDSRPGDTLDDAAENPAADASACMVELAAPTLEGGAHVQACAAVTYGSRPPSSGTHYPSWPVFRAYDKPVPWGYLVHGLEHGAIVIAYNCPDGCPAEVSAVKSLMATVPKRDICGQPPVILTPDPTLDVRFAASAWGYTLRASCFDRQAFSQFISDHADRGPELLAGDCGAVDFEAPGWCPTTTP
jgi:hypothetical protein